MMSDHNHVDDEFFDANQVVETSPFAAAARRRGGAEDEMMIENGRGKKDLSLDDSSFELANCSTSLSSVDFNRMKQEQEDGAGVGQALRKRYFDEVSSFVKTKLGCDNVICYQQTFNDSDVNYNNNNNSQDGTYDDMSELYKNECPHTDSSTRSSDELALSLLAEQREQHNMYQRYVALSLLRYIEPEEKDDVMTTVYRHLALLDERTAVKPDDYEKAEVKRDGGRAMAEQCYMLSTRHASNHKWFYFPSMEMQKDVILIKQMDSDWTKSGRMSFRMNVNDPTRRNSSIEERVMVRTRKSTEVRMVCYWKQTANGINSMPTPEDVRIRIGLNTPHPTRTSNVTPVRRHPVINLSPSGVQDNRSWLEKLMDGESTVNEWMGKIESISTGLLDSTENLTLSDVVAKCQAGAGSNNKPDEKAFFSASITNNLEGYWGRYQKTYDDSYDDKYKREYLDKFVSVVETFPSWPPSSKSWVRSEMRKFGHREVDRGIAEITCVIVDDSMGLVGTGNLPTSEKKKIIDFLIRSEIYMHVALKHWGDLAQDTNALHSHSMIQEDGPVPVTSRGQHLNGRRQAMINLPQYQQGMMMMSNAGRFEQNPYGEEVDYSMTNKNVHSLELQHHLMEQHNDGYDEQNRDDDQQTPYPVMQPEGRREALLSHYIDGSQDQQNTNGGHANKSTAVPPPPSSYYYNVDAPYNKHRHNQQQQQQQQQQRVGEVADPWDERTPSM